MIHNTYFKLVEGRHQPHCGEQTFLEVQNEPVKVVGQPFLDSTTENIHSKDGHTY